VEGGGDNFNAFREVGEGNNEIRNACPLGREVMSGDKNVTGGHGTVNSKGRVGGKLRNVRDEICPHTGGVD